jgi:hypothetical protein
LFDPIPTITNAFVPVVKVTAPAVVKPVYEVDEVDSFVVTKLKLFAGTETGAAQRRPVVSAESATILAMGIVPGTIANDCG